MHKVFAVVSPGHQGDHVWRDLGNRLAVKPMVNPEPAGFSIANYPCGGRAKDVSHNSVVG